MGDILLKYIVKASKKVASANVNSTCTFLLYQEKLSDQVLKLKKERK